MTIWCKLFGHDPYEYADIKRSGCDNIGRAHARFYLTCRRCDEKYNAGAFHPTHPDIRAAIKDADEYLSWKRSCYERVINGWVRQRSDCTKPGYWYLHTNGEFIHKPFGVVDMGGGPEEYFDSPFVQEWWRVEGGGWCRMNPHNNSTHLDIADHRASGELCTRSNGKEIVWNGHFCEGANLTPYRDVNFCLWTRCQVSDVPANAAQEGNEQDVVCVECLRIAHGEATK